MFKGKFMPCLLQINASIALQASFNNIEKLTVITPGNKGIHTRQVFYKDKVCQSTYHVG